MIPLVSISSIDQGFVNFIKSTWAMLKEMVSARVSLIDQGRTDLSWYRKLTAMTAIVASITVFFQLSVASHLGRDNLVVTRFGDFDRSEIRRLLNLLRLSTPSVENRTDFSFVARAVRRLGIQ